MMPKVNISLSEEVLKEVDKASREKHICRSDLIRQASLVYLKILELEEREQEKKESIEKAIQLQNQVRKKAGKWDTLSELKKWRKARR